MTMRKAYLIYFGKLYGQINVLQHMGYPKEGNKKQLMLSHESIFVSLIIYNGQYYTFLEYRIFITRTTSFNQL